MTRSMSLAVLVLSFALATGAHAQVEETASFSIVRMLPAASARLPQDPVVVVATREEHLYGTLQRGPNIVELDDKIELLAPCSTLCVFKVPLRGLDPAFTGAGEGQLTVYDRNQTQTRSYRFDSIIDDAVPVMPPLDVSFSVRSESIGGMTEEAVASVQFAPPQDETHVVAVMIVRRAADATVGEVVRATNDVVNPQTALEINVPLGAESCISAFALDAAGRESRHTDEACGRPESAASCSTSGAAGSLWGLTLIFFFRMTFFPRRPRGGRRSFREPV